MSQNDYGLKIVVANCNFLVIFMLKTPNFLHFLQLHVDAYDACCQVPNSFIRRVLALRGADAALMQEIKLKV